MSIDFDSKEGREGYLQAKMDDLLEGINNSYGQALLDELMARLDMTISDFNEEVQGLMNALKENSTKKEQLLQRIKSGELAGTQAANISKDSTALEDVPEQEQSAWEKRLEGISK